MMTRYTLPVEKDEDGELMLTFPDELMEAMNWKPGDVLEWTNNGDGTWSLEKLT